MDICALLCQFRPGFKTGINLICLIGLVSILAPLNRLTFQVLLNVVVAILMVQLNVANEELLLESLRDQSQRLADLSANADETALLEELGLDQERKMENFKSDIMQKKAARDKEAADELARNRQIEKMTQAKKKKEKAEKKKQAELEKNKAKGDVGEDGLEKVSLGAKVAKGAKGSGSTSSSTKGSAKIHPSS